MVTVALKSDLIELLNKNIGKDAGLRALQITFANPQGLQMMAQSEVYEIKFHKYLKNLRSLHLLNIADKNFTETMFDMASIRKLKELNLSFVPDLSLPQFSDALSKFSALQTLRISQITNWGQRINTTTLLTFISDGAINLRNLTLDLISFSDE